jgi:pimeloyl-ACP methyl ester carboxylesterase
VEITSGSAVLAAGSTGSGSPGVLLVHAGVTDQRSWRHVVDALPDHRCLTYDARAHGRTSSEPEHGWSAVGDAVAVLDAYDVARAVVVGSSMGGRTAIDLALTHPERVHALVLIGPAMSGAPEPTYEPEVLALDEEWDAAEERGDLDAVSQIEARVWLDGPTAAEGRVGGAARDLFLEMNRRALAAEDPGEQGDDVAAWDRLGEIAVPTLVLVGEHDLQYIKANSARAAAAIPDVRLIELPGVAHQPQLEGDAQTIVEITAFVASV